VTDFGRRVAVGPTTHEELCDALALLTPPGVCLDRATETELCDQLETLTPPAYCLGGPNILPKTGQTISHEDHDDGYYERGWTDTERFTDNEDGTVTDNATGLMWIKDWGLGVGHIMTGGTYHQAMAFAVGLDFAGHQDWTLPNLMELNSIWDRGASAPMVYAIFDGVVWINSWSSTTHFGLPALAYLLDCFTGLSYEYDKTWPVGQGVPVRTAE